MKNNHMNTVVPTALIQNKVPTQAATRRSATDPAETGARRVMGGAAGSGRSVTGRLSCVALR